MRELGSKSEFVRDAMCDAAPESEADSERDAGGEPENGFVLVPKQAPGRVLVLEAELGPERGLDFAPEPQPDRGPTSVIKVSVSLSTGLRVTSSL